MPVSSRKLVVQTAKIGDYINSTCVFDALFSNGAKFDVVIDKTNESLAKYDERIECIYLQNYFRENLIKKVKLAQLLFAQRYSEVIVLLPNQYNLFLGAFCTPTYNATIRTYGFGVSSKILSLFYHRLIKHERDHLTLDSYSKCTRDYDGISYEKSLKIRNFRHYDLQNEKNLKIAGVSLSAGAEWKNLPIDEWQWVFSLLAKNNFFIAVIGIGGDAIKLRQILSERDFAEKPAKTTECIAPILAQAKIAIANSGTIGMYRQILFPFFAPLFFKTLANLHTSACNSLYEIFLIASFGLFGTHFIAVWLPLFSKCLSIQFFVIFNLPP